MAHGHGQHAYMTIITHSGKLTESPVSIVTSYHALNVIVSHKIIIVVLHKILSEAIKVTIQDKKVHI